MSKIYRIVYINLVLRILGLASEMQGMKMHRNLPAMWNTDGASNL